MAKIFVTGRPPIEVTQDEAIRTQEKWIASKTQGQGHLISEILEVGHQTFQSKDIRGFEIIDFSLRDYERSEYNVAVDGPEKEKVRAFEKTFEKWIEENLGKYKSGERFNWFMQGMKAIRINGEYHDYTIIDFEKHKELTKLFASLNTLMFYREKAASNTDPDCEANQAQKFEEIKKNLLGEFDSAEIKAAAKEFDRQYDTGEIDPNKIPF